MRKIRHIICSVLIAGTSYTAYPCTAAIISATANPSGRAMLWKHRDTSATDNVVDYIPSEDGSIPYVALFNAADIHRREAWMGMNDAGFAIMNTASYNLKDDDVPESKMDREGILMTQALRTCRTLDDFRHLLNELPRPMGVEANFGVLDASGEAAWFETNNHSWKEYNLRDSRDGMMIRTNFSEGGRPGEGLGRVRAANAEYLLRPYAERGEVTPELLTEQVSRSFWHDVMQQDVSQPLLLTPIASLTPAQRWAVDIDYIPRYKSTSTVVIEGRRVEGEAPSRKAPRKGEKKVEGKHTVSVAADYIMWTGLGYPPCAEIYPVWCAPDGVHPDLQGTMAGGEAPAAHRAKERRADVFGHRVDGGDKYIDLSKLFNSEGSGYVQTLVPQNMEVYRVTREKRDNSAK